MRSSLFTLALALTGVNAATLSRRWSGNENCCDFSLSVGGSPVEQIYDGQLRVYETGLTNNSTFCLKNGYLNDNSGRECVVSPPTDQVQCDKDGSPSPGFSVSSSGYLEANGSTTFYACPTGENGGYNIYTMTLQGQSCKTIMIMVNGGNCVQTTTTTTMMKTTTMTPTTTMPPTTTMKPTTTAQPTCPTTTETCTITESTTMWQTMTCTASTVTEMGSTVTVTKGGATVTETCTETQTETYTVTAACMTSSMAPPPPTTTSMAPPPTTSAMTTMTTSSPPTTTAPPATTTAAGKTCDTSLTGAYQTPHLIVPINSASPDTEYGTSYNGEVSSTISSIFDFDIPSSYEGDTCTIIFLFPTQAELTTSSFTTSGSGTIDFYSLSSPATLSTTYDTCPATSGMLASISAMPGNSYVVSSGPCAAGQRIGVLAKATGSYALKFFEDYNPSPIGVFLTAC